MIAHDHFHDAWLDNCENKLLRDEALRLRALTSWHRRYFDFSDIDFKSSLQVHRKILEVVKISSPEEAGKVENIVKENILSAVTRILRATRNERNKEGRGARQPLLSEELSSAEHKKSAGE